MKENARISRMETTPNLLLWLIPVLAFAVMGPAIWCFVCAILATASGYRTLSAFRVDRAAADEGEELPTAWWAMIGLVSYRGGLLTLRASPAGLSLRIPRIFPFHKPIRVPWERIQDGGPGARVVSSVLLDGRVRLRVPETTHAAILDAKERLGAWSVIPF